MKCLTSVFQRTTNLCFYKYNGAVSGIFPKVTTLTLIHCKNIPLLLQPSVFPNLLKINHLSLPVEYIHYPNVSWVYPIKNTSTELGVGYVDENLISKYIHDIKHVGTKKEIALTIPDYGLIDGEVYAAELAHFFKNHKNIQNSFHTYHNTILKRTFMEVIQKDY